jgi:hypothetical protein
MRFVGLIVMILTADLFSGTARAAVIWNTFAPGDVFSETTGSAIEIDQIVANQFTIAGGDYRFDQLEAPAGHVVGMNIYYFELREDDSGVPGAVLEAFIHGVINNCAYDPHVLSSLA